MHKSAWILAAVIIWTTIGSGCATTDVRYVAQPLPLLARPVLPRVAKKELACLLPDTYRRVVLRDRLRREYAEELEAIIKATQPEAD